MRSFLGPTALLIGLAIALSACGGGTSPEEDVREAALAAGRTQNPKAFCRQMVTARYLDEVFGGDVEACVKSSIVEGDPGRPVVEGVVVKGEDEDVASVAVREVGGDADGSGGHLRFALEEDEWKLDRYETDYMRSIFATGIEVVDEGAIAGPEMKECLGEQVERLSDDSIRSLTLHTISDKSAAADEVAQLAGNCPGPLADALAQQIAESLAEDGSSPKYVHCIRNEISTLLAVTGISEELIGSDPSDAATAALEGIALAAKEGCGH